MKAMLEFDLPGESDEHRLALDGHVWRAMLRELDDELRKLAKYGGDEAVKPSEVRTMVSDIMAHRGLQFD